MPRRRTTATLPPVARPSLDTPLPRDDGSVVTVADQIVALLNAGTPPELAAAACGITTAEYRAWMRAGLAGLDQLRAGRQWASFTLDEQANATFADRVSRAVGSWAGRANAVLEQLARGDLTRTRSSATLDANGNVTERTEVRETILPDARVLTWRLERAFPSIYGRNASGGDLVGDTSDEPSTLDVLTDRLQQVARRMLPQTGAVIDVTEAD